MPDATTEKEGCDEECDPSSSRDPDRYSGPKARNSNFTSQLSNSQTAVTWATVVLALCSVLGICLTMLQLRLTDDTLKSSNDSSDKIIAQMKTQNDVAKLQAEASIEAVKGAEERFRRDQRAWITIDQTQVNYVDSGKPV